MTIPAHSSPVHSAWGWGRAYLPCLSLRQPWIWAIYEHNKDLENRSWLMKYRGEVLLHASKSMTRAELEAGIESVEWATGADVGVTREELQFGGIVGSLTIGEPVTPRGVVPASTAPFLRAERPLRWHVPGQWGYPLTGRRRLVDAAGAPVVIPWLGERGLFRVERAKLAQALRELGCRFQTVGGEKTHGNEEQTRAV